MKLKVYQEDAVKELTEKTVKLLDYSESKKLVFKSPTGSGKTIIVAEFLKKLVTDSGLKKDISFIWAAPRPVLTNQSKEKLENYSTVYKPANRYEETLLHILRSI